MASFLKDMFAEKLVVDDRVPSWTGTINDKTEISLYLPKFEFYTQFGVLFVQQMILAMIIGAVTYRYIVVPQQQNKSELALSPYLIGFGILIPFLLALPFAIIQYLDIRSRAVRFATITSAVTASRVLASTFGFTPSYATNSQKNLIRHFGSLLELKWDEKTNTPIRSQMDKAILHHLINGLLTMLLMVILFSWLGDPSVNYEPFLTSVSAYEFMISLDAHHLYNNFACAVLLSTFLNFTSHIIGAFFPVLLGYETVQLVDNPMFLSTSPSDFWGRRWNSLGHVLLKRGFYKPVRRWTESAGLGALAAFIGSGLVHEWVSYVLFLPNAHETVADGVYYFPVFGKQMGFFGWNGILVVLEYIVVATGFAKPQRQCASQHLPGLAMGMAVVLSALPVGHWMTGDLVKLDFFKHLSLAFPKVDISSIST